MYRLARTIRWKRILRTQLGNEFIENLLNLYPAKTEPKLYHCKWWIYFYWKMCALMSVGWGAREWIGPSWHIFNATPIGSCKKNRSPPNWTFSDGMYHIASLH